MRESTEYIKGYIKGITEMAAELSGGIGLSSMTAEIFDPLDYEEELAGEFGMEPDLIVSESSEVLLMDIFSGYFGDSFSAMNSGSRLINMIRRVFGDDRYVAEFLNLKQICERYSGFSGGKGPYYIVESMFVVVFEDAAVLFIMGSDE